MLPNEGNIQNDEKTPLVKNKEKKKPTKNRVQEALRKHDADSFKKSKLDRVFLQRLGLLFMIGIRSRWAPRILFSILLIAAATMNFIGIAFTKFGAGVPIIAVTRDKEQFWYHLAVISGVTLIGIFFYACIYYSQWYLGVYFRLAITEHIHTRYLKKKMYYNMNCIDKSVDNPDQRMVEDIDTLTTKGFSLFANIAVKIAIIVIVAYHIPSTPVGIYGLLLCFAYVFLVFIVDVLIMGKVVPHVFAQERMEGEFRYAHTRVRTYAESIAFYNGEEAEHYNAAETFKEVLNKTNSVIRWQFVLGAVSGTLMDWSTLWCSVIFALQRFYGFFTDEKFDGMSTNQVNTSYLVSIGWMSALTTNCLTIFAFSNDLSTFSGTVNRIGELVQSLESVEDINYRIGSEAFKKIPVKGNYVEGDIVQFNHVTFYNPGCQLLAKDLSFTVENGKSLIIMGPSGCGKSSVLRILAGIWPLHQGTIVRPESIGKNGMLFLPQRPYMVLGSFRNQVTYPTVESKHEDSTLREILKMVELESVLDKVGGFDSVMKWEDVLSIGEQQRIAIARVYYHKPQIAVLDESTSALSEEHERNFYSTLKTMNISFISVGHRSSLVQYHDEILKMDGNGEGGWSILSNTNKDAIMQLERETDDQSEQIPNLTKPVEDDLKKDRTSEAKFSKRMFKRMGWLVKEGFRADYNKFVFVGLLLVTVGFSIAVVYTSQMAAFLQYAVIIKDEYNFLKWFTIMITVRTVQDIISSYTLYLNAYLVLIWRKSITEKLHQLYFRGRTYYKMLCIKRNVDNPDQRICSDTYNFSFNWINFFFNSQAYPGLSYCILVPTSIVIIYWDFPLRFILAGAAVWFLLHSTIIALLSGPIARYTYVQSQLEGNFRYAHARLRNYAESIAFYKGEQLESENIDFHFRRAIKNEFKVVTFQATLNSVKTFFESSFSLTSSFLPVFYFVFISASQLTDAETLETVNRISTVCGLMFHALNAFIAVWGLIGTIVGFSNRLGDFVEKVVGMEEETPITMGTTTESNVISMTKVSIKRPDADLTLVKDVTFSVSEKGLIVRGPSGNVFSCRS